MMTLIKPYTRDLPYSFQAVSRSGGRALCAAVAALWTCASLPASQRPAIAHCAPALLCASPPKTRKLQLLENITDPAHGACAALLGCHGCERGCSAWATASSPLLAYVPPPLALLQCPSATTA